MRISAVGQLPNEVQLPGPNSKMLLLSLATLIHLRHFKAFLDSRPPFSGEIRAAPTHAGCIFQHGTSTGRSPRLRGRRSLTLKSPRPFSMASGASAAWTAMELVQLSHDITLPQRIPNWCVYTVYRSSNCDRCLPFHPQKCSPEADLWHSWKIQVCVYRVSVEESTRQLPGQVGVPVV